MMHGQKNIKLKKLCWLVKLHFFVSTVWLTGVCILFSSPGFLNDYWVSSRFSCSGYLLLSSQRISNLQTEIQPNVNIPRVSYASSLIMGVY